ncbi:hypothetical protein RHODGE_RHODGE_03164 [Rhodoplanes serenus]|uniref:Uncharacterized protein n=1 Tax=Rhodoplanes serenus TaxID=200615 RepID=A0A447CW49_9BRAD|nr:hypothetical protein [Rhodoplanes serenus]MBI5114570.1 hypothetical protein [Rhodovulum sp.]VCU09480.1 hypothetical protein RHODGE_RHODGE_03164 [Rhodoplanes serenus]
MVENFGVILALFLILVPSAGFVFMGGTAGTPLRSGRSPGRDFDHDRDDRDERWAGRDRPNRDDPRDAPVRDPARPAGPR